VSGNCADKGHVTQKTKKTKVVRLCGLEKANKKKKGGKYTNRNRKSQGKGPSIVLIEVVTWVEKTQNTQNWGSHN